MQEEDGVVGGALGGSPTRVRLIETAERLFADRGLDGVSLRQISAAAGQHNNFAVQHHFGSKQGLLRAIFAHRLPAIEQLRSDLMAEVDAQPDPPGVRELLDVLLRPLARQAEDPDSRYVSFIVRSLLVPSAEQPWTSSREDAFWNDLSFWVMETISERLDHLPDALRRARSDVAIGSCLYALAAYEQQSALATAEAGERSPGQATPLLPFDVFVTDLLDTTAASLLAPLSAVVGAALQTPKQKPFSTPPPEAPCPTVP